MSQQLITFRYTGTGLGIMWRVILGFFLTVITLGLYYPWLMNGLVKYACSHVEVNDPRGGTQPKIRFTGSGLGLLLRFIGPWAVNGMFRYAVENIEIDPS